ncbi:hypothetical protein CNYM01_04118 [Colletotrichum nymphaeae SA-01]|uniref:Uncharacterized protein n=1 Tax=Colletotrichum nymphaeae SA-01 TaxID=1460502 RepID=A0A135T3J6_9PEZI|nr:hypothetical protein CNYM01_04118 [Colletotrichum nymphaeae SA-01]
MLFSVTAPSSTESIVIGSRQQSLLQQLAPTAVPLSMSFAARPPPSVWSQSPVFVKDGQHARGPAGFASCRDFTLGAGRGTRDNGLTSEPT